MTDTATRIEAPEQPSWMNPQPEKQHRWLQKLIGEWTYESTATDQSGAPTKATGTENVRPLGELWVLAEGEGEMPGGGGPAKMLMTLGYDPQKKRFIGTWVGSMMTHMFIYDGELDPAERILTLNSEGPSMSGEAGKMDRYQDVIEIKGPDQRTLTSRFLKSDGTWQQFMTAEYRRKK